MPSGLIIGNVITGPLPKRICLFRQQPCYFVQNWRLESVIIFIEMDLSLLIPIILKNINQQMKNGKKFVMIK